MRNRNPKQQQAPASSPTANVHRKSNSSDGGGGSHSDNDDGIDQHTVDPLAIPSLRHYPYMPSKLRQLLSDPLLEVTGRIFKDVVIRLPMIDAGEEDIIALASHFGQVEYVSNALNGNTRNSTKMARSFGPNKSAVAGVGGEAGDASSSSALQMAATPEEGDKYCHYVRFSDGTDAIRCVLQLNGTVIDPALHRRTMDHLLHMVEQQQPHAAAEVENALVYPAAEGTEEASLWQDLKDAVHASREARYSLRCADPQASVIVVTCDFFRNAFREGGGLHDARVGLMYPPARSTRRAEAANARSFLAQQWARVTGAKPSSPAGTKSSSPTTATVASPSSKHSPASPLKQHQYALYTASIILEHWYHSAGYAEAQRRRLSEEGDEESNESKPTNASTSSTAPVPSTTFDEMMFITNYFTFFFHHDAHHLSPTPTASADASAAAAVADFRSIAETQRMFIDPKFWGLAPIAVAHKTLTCVDNDVEGALAWLDTAAGEEELWSGYRRNLATSSNQQRSKRSTKTGAASSVASRANAGIKKASGGLVDQFVELPNAAKIGAIVAAILVTMLVTYLLVR